MSVRRSSNYRRRKLPSEKYNWKEKFPKRKRNMVMPRKLKEEEKGNGLNKCESRGKGIWIIRRNLNIKQLKYLRNQERRNPGR